MYKGPLKHSFRRAFIYWEHLFFSSVILFYEYYEEFHNERFPHKFESKCKEFLTTLLKPSLLCKGEANARFIRILCTACYKAGV